MRGSVLLAAISILAMGDATFAAAALQQEGRDPPVEILWPRARGFQADAAATEVERLLRSMIHEPAPIMFDPRRRWAGVLVEDGARGTLTITPCGVRDALSTRIELVAGEPSPMLDRCWAWLDVLDLAPGLYDVRFEGRPCVDALDLFLEGPWLVASPFDPGDLLVVGERDPRGKRPRNRLRTHHPTPEGYTAADGTHVSRAEVDALRAQVLASRTRPGDSIDEILAQPAAYLDAQGFDAATISAHLPEIRRACAAKWIDRDGRALALPHNADPLFEIDHLRRALAMHLLSVEPDPTGTCVALVGLPGDPPIVVGTRSTSPDSVPWYVAVGHERWHSFDRRLSRALLELSLPDSCKQAQLQSTQGWRESIWDDLQVWHPIRDALAKLLARESYRLVAGWTAVAERFQPDVPPWFKADSPGRGTMAVDVRGRGPLDRIPIGSRRGAVLDWTDVTAAFEACETAVSVQPWLVPWAREREIRLTAMVPLDLDAISATLWRATLPDLAPAFQLLFEAEAELGGNRKRLSVGRGVIAANGTLLITEALPRAGLQDLIGARMLLHAAGEQFVLVEPDGRPVVRRRAD